MQMDQVGRDAAIAIWGVDPTEGALLMELLEEWARVYQIALLMTGDERQAEVIQFGTISSAKVFLDFCERENMDVDEDMRERVIDRQMLQQLKAWIPFEPLHLPPGACLSFPTKGEAGVIGSCSLVEMATALLKIPAAERLVYILRFVMGYDYERIDVLLNLGSPIIANEAAYVALHMLRAKLGEKAN